MNISLLVASIRDLVSLHRTVASTLRIAAVFAACLILGNAGSISAAPPMPAQPRSMRKVANITEVIPAPLPAAGRVQEPLAELITEADYRKEFRGITQMSVDIRPRETREGKHLGEMPPDLAARLLTQQTPACCGNCRRDWSCFCFHWESSGLCHQPLYFEETNLERYGYSPRGLRLLQPFLSAGNFFLTVPLLPYKMAVQPPRQGIYVLGQYRPGSPVPYRVIRPQFRLIGVVAEAAVISGLIMLIP